MTAGAETVLADAWIEAQLSGSSAVTNVVSNRIYSDVAPPNIDYPFIVYYVISPDDVRGVSSQRIMSSTIYLVKATALSSDYAALQPLVEAIDAALDGQSGAVTGGNVLMCSRQRPHRQAETLDGNTYRHLGGEYLIQVQGD